MAIWKARNVKLDAVQLKIVISDKSTNLWIPKHL